MLIFFTACGETEPPPPQVDHLKKELTILRFEQDFFGIDTSRFNEEMKHLEQQYGEFADIYFRYGIPLRRGDFSPAEQVEIGKAFLGDTLSKEIYARSQALFSEGLQSSEPTLEAAIAYFTYYFPDVPTPDTLVTFLSQFQYAGFVYGDNQLALGLDMYLGPDFDYQSVNPSEPIFSNYLTRTYTPEHITSKLLQLLIEEQVPQPRQGRLIDYMLYNGKKLYLLDLVLPTTPDYLKLEITPAQNQWLQENEAPAYVYLQSEELLYETDIRKFRKYIDPSPNSPGMPEGAPGRSANYLGWKIIEAWVKNHPNASLQELLAISDGQRILAESRYKPKY
ncbi:MAG: hypothetical protein AAF828_08950 [Bacteroidota bacterium]